MAKTAKELLAQYQIDVASVSLGDVLRAMQDQDAKLDQVMATHAANFEERAKGIAKHASMNLGVVEGNVTRRLDALEERENEINDVVAGLRQFVGGPVFSKVARCEERLDKLERPGSTNNNMRQP